MKDWSFIRCRPIVSIAGSMLLVSTVCTPTYAGMPPFEPIAGFAPKSITFDKPGGDLDRWLRVLPCNVNRASVAVKFHKTNFDATWKPVARIMLHSGNDMDQRKPHMWLAATVRGPWKNLKPTAYVQLDKVDADGKLHEGTYGRAPVDLNKPVQIQMSWTAEGDTEISFNDGPPIRLPKISAVMSIAVVVSSAKFEFMDLKVGHGRASAFSFGCVS